MNRNVLYAVIAVLVVVIGIVGYRLYQEENEPGLELKVGEDGISVETN